MEPASIRTRNPGAMWGISGKRPGPAKEHPTTSAIPLRWGSKTTIYLSDGTGQGNNIAVFPTYVQGICAQIDLWVNSKNYKDKTFRAAITTWSGGNNVPSYINFVRDRVKGITPETVLNKSFWAGPMAIPFLKAQAWHEAGKRYPASDGDFQKAYDIFFGKTTVLPPANAPTPAPVVTPVAEAPKTSVFSAAWNWFKRN